MTRNTLKYNTYTNYFKDVIYILLQNFGYIPLFKQVCIKFIPLLRWTHFTVSFSTSRKINLKLYILDKKDIIKK